MVLLVIQAFEARLAPMEPSASLVLLVQLDLPGLLDNRVQRVRPALLDSPGHKGPSVIQARMATLASLVHQVILASQASRVLLVNKVGQVPVESKDLLVCLATPEHRVI